MFDARDDGSTLRTFADALRERRSAFAAGVLRHGATAGAPTLGALLFVDGFVSSLFEAHEESNARRLFDWTRDSLAPENVLRPPKDVAQALAPVLARMAPRTGLNDVAQSFVEEIVQIVDAAFAKDALKNNAQLDEVDAAINRLLNRLEGSDPLSAEHSRAVGSWCSRIARCLHLSEAEAKEMSRAGLVHDIGKIGVPKAILSAPRQLTEEEWSLMRAHTTHGEELVQAEEVLRPYRSAIRHHHERLDGSGYPDGLRGDAISQQAQIVAVADAFNAMIGRRPYRQPYPPAYALDQLEEHARTHFDPDIVRALRNVLHS